MKRIFIIQSAPVFTAVGIISCFNYAPLSISATECNDAGTDYDGSSEKPLAKARTSAEANQLVASRDSYGSH
eukprot:2691101-Rhodomonas_salina.1